MVARGRMKVVYTERIGWSQGMLKWQNNKDWVVSSIGGIREREVKEDSQASGQWMETLQLDNVTLHQSIQQGQMGVRNMCLVLNL